MKQFFYKVIYFPPINRTLRSVNKFLAPVLPSKIKLPPSGFISIKASNGSFIKLKTNQTSFLTKELFWKGTHLDFEYSRIFVELIKDINVFFDVGANIGYYSLLASKENPNCKVVAFEPARSSYYFFNENVRINHLHNIRLEQIAIAGCNGQIAFYEISNKKYKYLKYNLSGESSFKELRSSLHFNEIIVPSKTLDEYVKENSLQNIDLIKLDTEGTEDIILRNSQFVLENFRPIVICETLFNQIEGNLEEIFKQHGYLFFQFVEGHGLMQVDTIVREKDDSVRNCFFLPPEKFHLIEKFVFSKKQS